MFARFTGVGGGKILPWLQSLQMPRDCIVILPASVSGRRLTSNEALAD
jgi:hypothetical protein